MARSSPTGYFKGYAGVGVCPGRPWMVRATLSAKGRGSEAVSDLFVGNTGGNGIIHSVGSLSGFFHLAGCFLRSCWHGGSLVAQST